MNIHLTNYCGVSDRDINKTEKHLGVKFSSDYRKFLSKYDGAVPEENVFIEDESINVDQFIPLSEIHKILSNVEGLPDDAVPIAEAPSGNFIYLNKDDSSVWFWDHEIEGGDRKLAVSFDDFIQNLKPFDGESVRLQPDQIKSVWIDPNFKPDL